MPENSSWFLNSFIRECSCIPFLYANLTELNINTLYQSGSCRVTQTNSPLSLPVIYYQYMLHSRLASPLPTNPKQSVGLAISVARSKSTSNFTQLYSKLERAEQDQKNKEIKPFSRIQSAYKKKQDYVSISSLPKVSSIKGKLHLGKVNKPGLILSSETRNNPWADPAPINQLLINKKGLMDMINMGAIPKNVDFTELLNHRYQQMAKQKQPYHDPKPELHNQFFPTNPNLLPGNQDPMEEQKQQKKQTVEASSQMSPDRKGRKKVKKGQRAKKEQYQFQPPQQPTILQISNQKIEKTQKYIEQLKKMKRVGQEVVFRQFIKRVEEFAVKYKLRKFQFRLLLDETRRMSDTIIKNQICNGKALGIYVAMKGNARKRIREVALMFAARFKFKKSIKDLFKIENIKRYFKIKKFYEEMTKKRCNFLKFKLGSFAERQRRFLSQAQSKQGAAEKFRVHIHILGGAAATYQQQLTYYKVECRNNIELTRIFSQQPESLILLMEQQQCDLSCWLKMLAKVKGYQPRVEPIFSNLKNSRVKTYDSIYYGLNPSIIARVKQVTRNTEDACIYPSAFCSTLVKICEALNAKLYSSSFWKPHLDRLLQEQDENLTDLNAFGSFKNELGHPKGENMQELNIPSGTLLNEVSISVIKSRVNFSVNEPVLHTQAQIKHLVQKAKVKQLNSYELNSTHFSNKLTMKNDILLASHCTTPYCMSYAPATEENYLLRSFTESVLTLKNVNKWVFKLGTTSRFSRGLAFLETNSLKILKEKKKRVEIIQADIVEVANIMKVILVDKLQIPQNSLFDSIEYLESFLKLGGYVEAVVEDVTTQCVFGKISAYGDFQMLGNYTKLYTDQVVNCAATYPSHSLALHHIEQARELSQKMYVKCGILGYVTIEMLVEKKSKKCHFIDLVLSLEQYSSLYFMYTSLFSNLKQVEPSLNVLRKVNRKKTVTSSGPSAKLVGKERLNSNSSKASEAGWEKADMIRHVVYVPFIDNNGNKFETFGEFEDACSLKPIKMLDFEEVEGLQFLYLNLKEQRPDVLSLVAFSENDRKCLKYVLDGLNFLSGSGEQTNKFDKRVERRKYDCLYLHDVIWKLRQLKKSKDLAANKEVIAQNDI